MRRFQLLLLISFTLAARAQDSDPSALTQRLDALQQEVQALKDAAKTPAPRPPEPLAPQPLWVPVDPENRFTGLSPVASKIYFQRAANVTAGLSADFFAFKQQGGSTGGVPNTNRSNVAVLAPQLGLRLAKRLAFNAQWAFENGGAESSSTVSLRKGESVVRMAYVDWFNDEKAQSGVRLGHQLVPVGVSATLLDPTDYFGVQRPELERELIPGAWHENGVTLWIDRGNADVQIGAFSSLDATGFRQDTFLAGGRSQGQNSPSSDLMGVLRINARRERLSFGVSAAFGNTSHGAAALRSGGFQLGEAHASVNLRRARFSTMLAQGGLQDADSISIVNSQTIAEQAKGFYVEGAVELLGQAQKLWLFARHSHYNLHDKVPTGFNADPSLNKTVSTVGVSFYPLANFVVKADYASKRSQAGNDPDEFNLGAGFIF